MSFDNLTNFKVEVSDFLHRGEITAGASQVESWISLAEADLNSQARTRHQEDFTANVATTGYLVHPSDWLAHKVVSYQSGSRKYDLQPYSEESAVIQTGPGGGTDAEGYVVRGDKTYLVPYGSGTYHNVYYKKIPALTSSATTNWLLTNYPQIYLGFVLKYAALWGYDDGRIGLFVSAAQQQLGALNNASKLASFGQVPQARPDRYY